MDTMRYQWEVPSDLEVVRAYDEYERELSHGGVCSLEEPPEILLRQAGPAGRCFAECKLACISAGERGLVRWDKLNALARGPTEKGRALLTQALTH